MFLPCTRALVVLNELKCFLWAIGDQRDANAFSCQRSVIHRDLSTKAGQQD